MLTYKRYQALRAIHIRVPGEPGNEANYTCAFPGSFPDYTCAFPGSFPDYTHTFPGSFLDYTCAFPGSSNYVTERLEEEPGNEATCTRYYIQFQNDGSW